ncbi:unnamed protein product [Polarella glacialis]|uniref:Uncharacterized protein n=1 Tax=Polarella glacialis TaxID=89957 RepID=A0A813IXT1_POLGL|nr:unnamed protein product [Polarella glacialis]
MAPLSMASRELVRNRTAAQAEAVRLASGAGSSTPRDWLDSEDWRVRLGAASALSLKGAPQLAGDPQVRDLLVGQDGDVKRLVATTLVASGAMMRFGVARAEEHQCEESSLRQAEQQGVARTVSLLQSSDWRLRFGAVEALSRRSEPPVEHAHDLAKLLVADLEAQVRVVAEVALRRFDASVATLALASALESSAATEALADDSAPDPATESAELLLVELLGGDLARAVELLPTSPQLCSLLEQKQEEDERRRDEDLEEKHAEEDMARQQQQLQLLQLQMLHLQTPALRTTMMAPTATFPEERRAPARPLRPDESVVPLLSQRPLPGFFAKKRRPRAPQDEAPLEPDLSPKVPSAASSRTPEAAARLAAAKELSKLGPEELFPKASELADLLLQTDGDGGSLSVAPYIREAAAEALGRLDHIAGPQTVKALTAQLVAPESRLRQRAAHALGRLGAVEAAEDLAKLLGDGDADVRRAAARALAALGPAAAAAPAAARLRSADAACRQAAQHALLEMRLDEDLTLASGCSREELLLQVLSPHLEPLLQASGDETEEARFAAAAVAERLRRTIGAGGKHLEAPSEQAAAPAAVLLEDREEEVRFAAVRTLGGLGAQAAPHAAAVAALLADAAEPVRRAAAEALAQLGSVFGAGAVPVAADLLRHPLQSVRRAAAWTLEHLGEAAAPYAAARRLALLSDDCPSTRCQAVEELSAAAAQEAAAAKEGAAMSSLLRAEDVAAIAALRIDPHWGVRLAVATALGRFGQDAAQRHSAELVLLKADTDWRVRRAAEATEAALGTCTE